MGKKNKKKIYIMIIELLHSNYEFLFYLSIFYSIYILYKKGRNLEIINKSPIELDKSKDNGFKKFWLYFAILSLIICFYCIFNYILGFNYISNNEYRIIKLILGFLISIITLYINIKEKGLKSWRTLFSFFSLFILIFYGSLLLDENWKIFIYEKFNFYITVFSIWIFTFISFFHMNIYICQI